MNMLKMSRASNNGAATGSSFPAANNLLQKKWNDRAYKLHREKVKTTKTKLDTTKPKECPHLHLNLKKIQMEEEKQALIDRDNRILLSKLTNVLRSDGSVDNWNYDYENRPKTLHAPQMQREQERIAKENEKIMKRLNHARGTYNFEKMEDDFLMHEYYKSMKAQETKTYELQARGFEEDDGPPPKKHAEQKTPREDGEQEDGEAAAAEEDKLPAMEDTKKKPPPSKRPLKKQATKLPLLGVERRKEEEKKRKEAISKPAPYDEREDATKLFKAIKGMLKAEPILTQVLARRTYAQRQQTIARFNQQFQLDLEDDLKTQLDDEFDGFVSSLLARREEVDAMALNHALKGQDSLAETFIEILCTRNNTALGIIKSAYHRLYGVELEEDIKAEVKGQLKHMFLALAKGNRNESATVNSDVAEMDARELADDENDRWAVNGEKLGELLADASFDHIRGVFQQYATMTDWTILAELKKVLTGDYKDAMIALVKCLDNCASFMADQIHKVLIGEAEESTLIRIMITRSEIDMLQIRRQYKKKYNETLIDGLENKCRSPIKKALIQMVLVHGVSQEEKDAWKKEAESKAVTLPKVATSPEKSKTLKGPQPDKTATLPDDNPLVRSTRGKLPKSPVRRVVTPRGLHKTPSSRSASGGRSKSRKPSKPNKATPKSSSVFLRQPTKPIQTMKQTTQSKPIKPVKPPTQPQQNKQTAAKPNKVKTDDRTKTIQFEQNSEERTKENVKSENESNDKDKNSSVKDAPVSDQKDSTQDQSNNVSNDNESEQNSAKMSIDSKDQETSEKSSSKAHKSAEQSEQNDKNEGVDDTKEEVKEVSTADEPKQNGDQVQGSQEATEQKNDLEVDNGGQGGSKSEQNTSSEQNNNGAIEQDNKGSIEQNNQAAELNDNESAELKDNESAKQNNNETSEQNTDESDEVTEHSNNVSSEQIESSEQKEPSAPTESSDQRESVEQTASSEQTDRSSQDQISTESGEQASTESGEQKEEDSSPAAVNEKVAATGGDEDKQTTKVEE